MHTVMEQPALNQNLTLTDEQHAVINSNGDIKINAVAGSGKTTTIIQYAASRPKNARILYVAFNKSVRMEARKRFNDIGLHHVQVETAHSLAFRAIVANSRFRVCANAYKTHEVAEHLGLKANDERHGHYILANHIGKFLMYFCNSTAEKVQDLRYVDLLNDDQAIEFALRYQKEIEQGTRLLLARMYKGEMEITHDFYLKLFQLSKPDLPFDYILFDEAQDASPAMLDVILRQKAVKVIVGDANQQIYSWRHAVNSLATVSFPAYQLQVSFRFRQDIAHLAMQVLSWKRHLQETAPVTIKGKGKPPAPKSKATLGRTNLGLLVRAIKAIREDRGLNHIYFEGNLHSYTYADEGASLYDVLHLFNKRHDRIRDKLIRSMGTLEDLDDYIEKTEDVQLGMMVDLVREYENEIPMLIQMLKNKHVADDDRSKAEMIFSTVHRAKGMEYDEVFLAEDFVTEDKLIQLREDKDEGKDLHTARWNEEINLLYVAVTRTRNVLHIPQTLLPQNIPASPNIRVIMVKNRREPQEPFQARSYYRRMANQADPSKNQADDLPHRGFVTKKSYAPWTPEMDNQLREMFNAAASLDELAAHFRRSKGAIQWRLKKIGFREP